MYSHLQRKVIAGHGLVRRLAAASYCGIACLALSWCAAAHADWILATEASARHDNNVGNAQPSSGAIGDSTLAAQLAMSRLFFLGEGYSVSVGGELNGEVFRRLTGLNNGTLATEVELKKKWGLGAFVPWARAGLSVGRSSYDDSYRNAWIYRASLASGRRFNERWNFWAQYAYERRVAQAEPADEDQTLSTDAFSQSTHNLGLNLQYSLAERTYLSLALLARHGDVVSTTMTGLRIFDAARALAEDPAFGEEAYAYRLTGTTLGYRLGLSFAATQHSVLGCGFERLDTRADGGNGYTKSLVELTWDYRF